ncbi:MAG: PilZ domain-containing protein [Myxococcota bacterium]|jgi:hypothetical protein
MSVQGTERRRYSRIPVRIDLEVGLERTEGLLVFETRDLGPGGAFLSSDLLLDVNDKLKITFIDAAGEGADPIVVDARVVRVYAGTGKEGEGHGPGMGIEFTNLSEEDRGMLQALLGVL